MSATGCRPPQQGFHSGQEFLGRELIDQPQISALDTLSIDEENSWNPFVLEIFDQILMFRSGTCCQVNFDHDGPVWFLEESAENGLQLVYRQDSGRSIIAAWRDFTTDGIICFSHVPSGAALDRPSHCRSGPLVDT
jgi:hypothetical protein